MNDVMVAANGAAANWIYYKLYPANQIERADNLLIELSRRLSANSAVREWFYLRYIDESGFHIRLRFLPKEDLQDQANRSVHKDCVDMLDHMYEYLPSIYQPMVTLPSYVAQEPPPANGALRVVADTYAPEYEKYGSKAAMRIAEGVFHLSSALAGQVLADEARGLYSRKELAPWLMHEPNQAFPTHAHADYWRQYSLYWLGGSSPAADDWRGRFAHKAIELREAGHAVLADENELPRPAADVVRAWRQGLVKAARDYAALKDGSDARQDVLSLNFAHLMMNRLGLSALEEAYIAALLESEDQALAQESFA